jgi:ribosome biogenesis protein Nip4
MTKFTDFLSEFNLAEQDIGHITRAGRRCFLTLPEHDALIATHKRELFGCGVFLGEEKERFEPSAALLELIAAKTREHKTVVDEKAAWLYLCDRDILDKGVVQMGAPTKSGYLLVQDERDENLGYGFAPGAARKQSGKARSRDKNVAVKNLLDRGFFLRRERLE